MEGIRKNIYKPLGNAVAVPRQLISLYTQMVKDPSKLVFTEWRTCPSSQADRRAGWGTLGAYLRCCYAARTVVSMRALFELNQSQPCASNHVAQVR